MVGCMDKWTDRHTDNIQMDRDRQMVGCMDTPTARWTNRKTDGQRHLNRESDRQTDQLWPFF